MSFDKPRSHFKRPWGTDPPDETTASDPAPAASPITPAELSKEWEILEGRIRACGPSADLTAWHAEVGQFLRHWGTAIAGLPVQQQIALANLMDSARASLLGLLEATSRAASAQSATAQAEGWRQAEMRQRQAMEQAEHRRRMEAGQAEVRRLQDETARIQAETYRSGQLSQERNFQLSRAALFPENHCPYCSRSYTDLSSGCWHCHAWPSGR